MSKSLRLSEVAQDLGVDPSTLRRWCQKGKGPRHIKTPGGTYIFLPEHVEEWKKGLEPTYSMKEPH